MTGHDRENHEQMKHPHLPRPATTIAGLVGLMLVFINFGALHLVLSQRSQTVEQARAESLNVATLLARQTDRAFEAAEVIEKNIVGKLRNMGVVSADDFRWMASQRIIHEQIAGEASQLNFINWFTILDDRGQIVSTSKQWPAPKLDLAGRDYFQALASKPGLDLFISRPIARMDSGELSIYIARKIRDMEGRFAGVVIGGVPASYFTNIYNAISLRPGSAISLVRDDGIVLSRSGDTELPLSLSMLNASGRSGGNHRADGAVTFTETGAEGRMLSAIAPLEKYPLRVVAGVTMESILAPWHKELGVIGLMVCLINASMILTGILGVRQLRESERVRRAEHYSARHDILTDLPNRSFFQETLARVRDTDGCGNGFGLILLDLDNFKEVNDSQGHQAGDELLRMVAGRLRSHLGSGDFLARLGGDEFAILQVGVREEPQILAVAQAILAAFRQPFEIQDRLFKVGASLGAVLGRPGDDQDALFDQADMALYQAKEAGRNMIRFFSLELARERQEYKRLVADLRQAIAENAFELHFQPIVDLDTCRLTAFEALLRWTHPERGSVPPSVFIPVAEETGLIRSLGAFVLREACRQAARWPKEVKVAVNLSSVQLQAGDIVADVETALFDTGLSAGRLELEITESVLLDVPLAQPILRELRALGVSISLDDFGTGYSSLSYLRSFPFHRLKIDRSFVTEMPSCVGSASIVRTIKELGDQLGMAVTAEGIETHEQLRRLQAIGPMSGQGYLFSRPVPAGETAMLIREFGVAEQAPLRAPSAARTADSPQGLLRRL